MMQDLSVAEADSVRTFALRADSGEVRKASLWLKQTAEALGVPADSLAQLDQCLDEALANVIMHGGEGARAVPVELEFRLGREGDTLQAAVSVSDAGIAFDPLAATSKPRPASLEEAEPGGLGLLLIRSSADHLDYRFSEGRNRLTFTVRWNQTR